MMKLLRMSVLLIFVFLLVGGNASAVPTWENGQLNIAEYSNVFSEDTESYKVDPGYGGQAYDVEHLALFLTDSTLYFGLQAGLGLKFGQASTDGYSRPGDIALDIGNDGTYEYGIRFWGDDIQLIEASTWANPECYTSSGPWRANGDIESPGIYQYDIAFKSGLKDKYGLDTNSLEGFIDLGLLGAVGQDIAVIFTMNCGNDVGHVDATAPVPEPATMFLFGTGLIGMATVGRKKFRK